MGSGSLFLFRQSQGQTTTVKMTEKSLSSQLSTLSESWNLTNSDRVLSIESPSNEFFICGVLAPIFSGADLFLLPPALAKQSPEVWARISERHQVTRLICRAREFSWATQAAPDINLDLSLIDSVILVDGRHPTCLNYATNAAYSLKERYKFKPETLKGIVWSDCGGVIGKGRNYIF